MDPKQPKSPWHTTLLSYTCQLIDLSRGCEIFFPIQDARIFHKGPFKDSQKIFEEFWSSQKNDYSPMSKMCQLKLEDLKFVTIFMVYMQECVDVRLKSLIYRCENHS